jgi:hypothetical protein
MAHQPNNAKNKGKNRNNNNPGPGEITPNKINLGETRTRVTRTPKGEITTKAKGGTKITTSG